MGGDRRGVSAKRQLLLLVQHEERARQLAAMGLELMRRAKRLERAAKLLREDLGLLRAEPCAEWLGSSGRQSQPPANDMKACPITRAKLRVDCARLFAAGNWLGTAQLRQSIGGRHGLDDTSPAWVSLGAKISHVCSEWTGRGMLIAEKTAEGDRKWRISDILVDTEVKEIERKLFGGGRRDSGGIRLSTGPKRVAGRVA